MGFALPVLPSLDLPASVQIDRAAPRAARISITDRCDMACVYCRPSYRDGYLPAEDRLSVQQWLRLLRGLKHAGVERIRITGGEPLLHRALLPIVECIHSLGFEDVALTTNASRLAELATPLRAAGLRRINISLDSLDPARFARLTRGGKLAEVLEGIDAACAAGFDEIKTNTVVLRDENEDELEPIVRWTWERNITPRFLEVMGVGEGARIFRTHLVPHTEQRERLAKLLLNEEALRDEARGPARYVRSRDGKHRVGFITGTSDTYCGGCDRLRVSSDGMLRPCLSLPDGVSVQEALQHEDSDARVEKALEKAWEKKPDAQWKGCTEATAALVSMRATGG